MQQGIVEGTVQIKFIKILRSVFSIRLLALVSGHILKVLQEFLSGQDIGSLHRLGNDVLKVVEDNLNVVHISAVRNLMRNRTGRGEVDGS